MSASTKRRPLPERFWEKVKVAGPDECWEWTGATGNNGYGNFRPGSVGRVTVRAHRVSYAMHHNLDALALPSDLIIRHTCDNRPCVNPAHLLSGTYADNARDTVERGRARNGYWVDGKCMKGHDVADGRNVMTDSNGSRRCRECNLAYEAARRNRRRVAA